MTVYHFENECLYTKYQLHIKINEARMQHTLNKLVKNNVALCVSLINVSFKSVNHCRANLHLVSIYAHLFQCKGGNKIMVS